MAENTDIIARTENSVCTLILNRPEKRNSLTRNTLELLKNTLEQLEKKSDIRCIVIRGSGDRAFCSGYDIGSISEEEIAIENSHPLIEAMEAVKSYPLPVIAMINGHAFGAGLELAATCDLRVCVADAKLAIPPVKLGVTYHYGGIKQFLNLVGPGFTRELFLTGNPVSAEKGLQKGLVDYVVQRDKLEELTYGLAAEIGENAPLPMISMKRMINIWEEGGPLSEKNEELIRSLLAEVRGSSDAREGKKAFFEKRKPVFKGK
ncbi:MAG: enoyl-CoA hydratase-related protein [Candidatus Dadabacteria bacterium]|nr:enoyl-CoA hydratase-related protein [Candidatus Dadabacteria bacterium]